MIRLEDIFWYLLLLSVFVSVSIPYPVQNNNPIIEFGNIGIIFNDAIFLLSLSMFFVLLLLKRRGFEKVGLTVLFFVVGLALPVGIALLNGDFYWWPRLLRVFGCWLYVPMFVYAIKGEENVKTVSYIFILSMFFSFSNFILVNFGYIELPSLSSQAILTGQTRVRSLVTEQYLPLVGTIISLGFIIFSRSILKKSFFILGGIVSFVLLILIGGRSDLVSLLFGIIVFVVVYKKFGDHFLLRHIALFCILSFFIIVVFSLYFNKLDLISYLSKSAFDIIYFYESNSFLTRFYHYWANLYYLFNNPWFLPFGHGLGLPIPESLKETFHLETVRGSGNAWMELILFYGVVGLFVFIYFKFLIFKKLTNFLRYGYERNLVPVASSVLSVWLAFLVVYTWGYPIITWFAYGNTIGWLSGISVYLAKNR